MIRLYDHILTHDPRYQAARRFDDGRGDPWDGGFRRRLSVEPAKADRMVWWFILPGAAVFTLIAVRFL